VVEKSDHAKVLETGEVFVDRRELARESDDTPDMARMLHHVITSDNRATTGRRQDRREDAYHRRLADPLGPSSPKT